jgi:hypothetical protein
MIWGAFVCVVLLMVDMLDAADEKCNQENGQCEQAKRKHIMIVSPPAHSHVALLREIGKLSSFTVLF